MEAINNAILKSVKNAILEDESKSSIIVNGEIKEIKNLTDFELVSFFCHFQQIYLKTVEKINKLEEVIDFETQQNALLNIETNQDLIKVETIVNGKYYETTCVKEISRLYKMAENYRHKTLLLYAESLKNERTDVILRFKKEFPK